MIATTRRGTGSREAIVGHGERIGGRDHGAERERRRPGEPRDELVRHDRDAARRRDHEAEREQRDRAHVRAQVLQRGEEGRRVEERRQERDEHDVRRQAHPRQARDEAEDEAAEHEQDRHRQPQRRREGEQRAERDDEREQLPVGVGACEHRPILPTAGPSAVRDGGQAGDPEAARRSSLAPAAVRSGLCAASGLLLGVARQPVVRQSAPRARRRRRTGGSSGGSPGRRRRRRGGR